MASPIAAGTIGLLRSYNMDWTNSMLETMILATADPIIYQINTEDYLQGKLGTGRVDALNALVTPLFPNLLLIGIDYFVINSETNIITPGDDIEVMVILLNEENWGTATNLTGELFSLNNNIDIINPLIDFDEVLPGMPIVNDDQPFQINLSENIDLGEYELNLKLTSNLVLRSCNFDLKLLPDMFFIPLGP